MTLGLIFILSNTVWKFKNFSATQIFREINFGKNEKHHKNFKLATCEALDMCGFSQKKNEALENF